MGDYLTVFVSLSVLTYSQYCTDTAARTKSDGYTLLYVACLVGHLPLVKYLLNECQVDKNEAIKNGATPMMAATEAGHDAVVKYLNEFDATNKAVDSSDLSATTAKSAKRPQEPEVDIPTDIIALSITENVVEFPPRSRNQYALVSHSEPDLTLTAHRPATAAECARQPVFLAPYLFPYPVDKNGNRRRLDNPVTLRPQTATPLPSQKWLVPSTQLLTEAELETKNNANVARKKKSREQRAQEKMDLAAAAKKALGVRSAKNTLGLPADVFENLQLKTSTGTGINFLRVMSNAFLDNEQPHLSKARRR